jgi:hypothetical protein
MLCDDLRARARFTQAIGGSKTEVVVPTRCQSVLLQPRRSKLAVGDDNGSQSHCCFCCSGIAACIQLYSDCNYSCNVTVFGLYRRLYSIQVLALELCCIGMPCCWHWVVTMQCMLAPMPHGRGPHPTQRTSVYVH